MTPETPRQQQNNDEGQGFQIFMTMENLIDKLKLLDYEEEFIKVLKMRPLNRYECSIMMFIFNSLLQYTFVHKIENFFF